MKAIRARRMGAVLAPFIVVLMASGCAERQAVPSPKPSQPAPAPPPQPQPAPSGIDWRRASLTPGDWTMATANGQPVARFGANLLALRCDRAGSSVVLERSGSAAGPVPVTIRTSSSQYSRSAAPEGGQTPVLSVRLAANDPALDAMAFSRGRFSVDVVGLPELIVPSWSEVGALVENCR